jgi:SNF2 family DNA or RNA helicase
MTLRKISNHPYLHVPELDPGNSVPPSEAFRQLTDASAKLVLLEKMLPKLQQQGHKVLIVRIFLLCLVSPAGRLTFS